MMPKDELTSSPCMIRDVNPDYMGRLTESELIDLLNELVRAERAGSKICALSKADSPSLEATVLLRKLQMDESRSCRALIECLAIMRVQPKDGVGDFLGKCMAIEDLFLRMKFLNRGQYWVIKKIEYALPRIIDPEIQKRLKVVLLDHKTNVDSVDAYLQYLSNISGAK